MDSKAGKMQKVKLMFYKRMPYSQRYLVIGLVGLGLPLILS